MIRACDQAAGITQAASHRRARIWRETVDRRTGQVTRAPATVLSPLTLALNRLYDGRGMARHKPASDKAEHDLS